MSNTSSAFTWLGNLSACQPLALSSAVSSSVASPQEHGHVYRGMVTSDRGTDTSSRGNSTGILHGCATAVPRETHDQGRAPYTCTPCARKLTGATFTTDQCLAQEAQPQPRPRRKENHLQLAAHRIQIIFCRQVLSKPNPGICTNTTKSRPLRSWWAEFATNNLRVL